MALERPTPNPIPEGAPEKEQDFKDFEQFSDKKGLRFRTNDDRHRGRPEGSLISSSEPQKTRYLPDWEGPIRDRGPSLVVIRLSVGVGHRCGPHYQCSERIDSESGTAAHDCSVWHVIAGTWQSPANHVNSCGFSLNQV